MIPKTLAEVKSVTFTEKEMALIKDQSRSLLNDYINFLNLLTDPKESKEDKGFYRISFLGLFKDSTISIANDIEPNPQNRWLQVKDYQKDLVTAYPEGIKNLGLNIDSAEYSKVVSEGNNKYYIDGYIDKFFSGKYQSKSIFRDNSKYDFKISFERDENTFKNFKLASIDKFGVNLYSQSTATSTQELPSKPITSISRKGLFIGLEFGGGLTSYSDKNLTGSSTLDWSIKGKSALNAEVLATWYLTNQVGVKIGLGYNRYSAIANLSGSYRNDKYFTDANDETYLKNITASYDSLLNFNYLTIPISIIFHSNKNPEKWGIYAEGGVIASINMNSAYKTTGSFATTGYYEQYPEAMQIISAPELGFVNRTSINKSGKSNISNFTLMIKTSIGITYPLNYFTTVYFGPEIELSTGNLSKEKNYIDAFGNTAKTKDIGILKYGIKFGISYKF
jgi:hypothetical protein